MDLSGCPDFVHNRKIYPSTCGNSDRWPISAHSLSRSSVVGRGAYHTKWERTKIVQQTQPDFLGFVACVCVLGSSHPTKSPVAWILTDIILSRGGCGDPTAAHLHILDFLLPCLTDHPCGVIHQESAREWVFRHPVSAIRAIRRWAEA